MAQTNDLEKKTVAQLKEIAKEMGIAGLSKMKKSDLIAVIQEKSSEAEPVTVPEPEVAAEAPEPVPEPEVSEPAPEPEVAEEEPEAEPVLEVEEVAAEAPEPEPEVSEPAPEPPAEEVAAEAPAEETVEAEPAPEPEEAPAEPVKAKEPKAEKPKVTEKPPTKLQLKIRGKYDILALKTEKKTLKGQIAVAIEAKDSAKVKELRKRKKEIRRILKKAS